MTEKRGRGQPPKPADERRQTLSLRLPAAFLAELRDAAAERGMTVTAAVEEGMRAWVRDTAD